MYKKTNVKDKYKSSADIDPRTYSCTKSESEMSNYIHCQHQPYKTGHSTTIVLEGIAVELRFCPSHFNVLDSFVYSTLLRQLMGNMIIASVRSRFSSE